MTTVTGRVRRVFTWSNTQFKDAVKANSPSVIFLNFCNYLRTEADVDQFVRAHVLAPYEEVTGDVPDCILLGFGPNSAQVKLWEG